LLDKNLDIFDIVEDIGKKLQIQVLALPYSILMELFQRDNIRPQHFKSRANGSPARFYSTLSSLEAIGHIIGLPDPHDGRAKLYRLSKDSRQHLCQLHLSWLDRMEEEKKDRSDNPGFMRAFSQKIRETMKVTPFSVEYQVILYLYDADELTAGTLRAMVNVSSSTFFKCLKQLIANNLIIAARDPQDKRIMRYRLATDLRPFIHERNRQVSDWVRMSLASGELLT
jgi:DNA-binding MarR family transcriptional regulator